jgi:hypothetical protein
MAIEGQSIKLPYPYPDLETSEWDAYALLSNLQFLASKITAIQQGQLVPTAGLVLMRSGSTCPDGYTKVTDAGLANRYLRLNVSSGGGTGGSATSAISSSGAHAHVTGVPSSTRLVTSAAVGTTFLVSTATHIHSISSSGAHTHAVAVTPLFIDVILCEKT